MTHDRAAPPLRQLLVAALIAVALHFLLLLGLPFSGSPARPGQQGAAFLTRQLAAPAVVDAPAPPRPAPAPRKIAVPKTVTPVSVQPPATTARAQGNAALQPQPSLLGPPPAGDFGAGMAPQPIAPPLPAADIPAALEFARGAGNAPVLVAPAARLDYRTRARIGGQDIELPTTLDWRQDGRFYQARWVLYGPRIGDHTLDAAGLLTPQGLAPVQARLLTAQAQDMRFDYPALLVHLSATGGQAPLRPGMQDRLSVLLQLGAMLAGDPARYPPGARIQLPAAHPDGAGQWLFTVQGQEPVDALGQSVPALRLEHPPQDSADARIEVWLAPALGYLPARLRVTEANGDTVEHTLQTAYTQQVPVANDK